MSRRHWLPSLLVTLGASPVVDSPAGSAGGDAEALARGLAAVDVSRIRSDLEVVASDAMAGRDTPSPGLERTARYLVQRLVSLGIAPGARDGYLHGWRRAWRQIDAKGSGIELCSPRGSTRLEFGEDYVFSSPREVADVTAEGTLRAAGDGSSAALQDVDLAGAWALVQGSSGSLRRTASRVARAGAVGLVVLPGRDGRDPAARYRNVVHELRQGRLEEPVTGVFPVVLLTFRGQRTLEEFSAACAGEETGALSLREVRRLSHPGGQRWIDNVCGFWEGSDPDLAREVILISAHYDHVGSPGGVVHNGADDNGSGTVGLLALAEALVQYGPLRRSVLLLWVSGEERGLLGSRAWADRPWLPAGYRPVAAVNMDMIGRGDPDSISVTPTARLARHHNRLERVIRALAATEGFERLKSADAFWSRSDQVSFAEGLHVPVAFLFAGLHEDYHKPTDDVEKIDMDKIGRVARLLLRVLDALQEDELDLHRRQPPDAASFGRRVRAGMVRDDLEHLRAACLGWARERGGRWPQDLSQQGSTLDPWGRAYLYVRDADERGGALLCLGSDGLPGGRGEAVDVKR